MKPMKLRQLLSVYGELDRMYLAPEDPSVRLRRKKFGGNTGKNFVEGWVEFKDKKKARATAEMLNGKAIGGKRRSAYYSDLWNMRYLPKFKWDNLIEEIEPAAQRHHSGAELIEYITKCCYQGDLLYLDAYGQSTSATMLAAAKATSQTSGAKLSGRHAYER